MGGLTQTVEENRLCEGGDELGISNRLGDVLGNAVEAKLLREVKEWFSGTILLSGAISDGYSVASALALGADLAYMGSRFIPTREANVNEMYKKMILDSTAKDIVYTSFFSGINGNYLRESIKNSGLDPDSLDEGTKDQMSFSNPEKPKVWKDIWGSGQGIGRIKEITSVKNVVKELEKEMEKALDDLINKTKGLKHGKV